MAQTNVLCVVLLGILSHSFGQFLPGCSFSNGKCIYNVQLGSQERCAGNKRAIDGACSCDDVTKISTDLNSLQSLVDRLQKSMTDFKNQLNNVTTTNQGLQTAGNQKYLQLLEKVQTKEDLLNRTSEEVANILKSASTEISSLREKLKNFTSELATCQVSNGIVHSTQTPQTTDYSTFYCSFQATDFCKFTNDQDDSADWTRESSQVSSTTGPKTDHTYGNHFGYYMVVKASDTSQSSSTTSAGRLTSSTFTPAPNYCVRFWYTMYGKDVDTLNVYAKVNRGRGYPIYSVHGNQGLNWHLAQIDLGPEYTKSSFQITFEASHHAYKLYHYVGGVYRYDYYQDDGNIAIDDVYVYNTTCSSLPSYPGNSVSRVDANVTSYYTFHKTPTYWYDAQDTCRRENVHSSLAVVKSASEQTFLTNVINSDVELTIAGQNGYYFNGNDIDSESNFMWTATGYPEKIQYSNFHQGQPNNVGNNQNCLLMEYPAYNYEWGDVDCMSKHPFLCETNIP